MIDTEITLDTAVAPLATTKSFEAAAEQSWRGLFESVPDNDNGWIQSIDICLEHPCSSTTQRNNRNRISRSKTDGEALMKLRIRRLKKTSTNAVSVDRLHSSDSALLQPSDSATTVSPYFKASHPKGATLSLDNLEEQIRLQERNPLNFGNLSLS